MLPMIFAQKVFLHFEKIARRHTGANMDMAFLQSQADIQGPNVVVDDEFIVSL
jgi:hypothetical protein